MASRSRWKEADSKRPLVQAGSSRKGRHAERLSTPIPLSDNYAGQAAKPDESRSDDAQWSMFVWMQAGFARYRGGSDCRCRIVSTFKVLSGAAKDIRRYRMLRKIGVRRDVLSRSELLCREGPLTNSGRAPVRFVLYTTFRDPFRLNNGKRVCSTGKDDELIWPLMRNPESCWRY